MYITGRHQYVLFVVEGSVKTLEEMFKVRLNLDMNGNLEYLAPKCLAIVNNSVIRDIHV